MWRWVLLICFIPLCTTVADGSDEKKASPAEERMSEECIKEALKGFESDFYYDRRNAEEFLKKGGESGLKIARRLWSSLGLSERARAELTVFLKNSRSREGALFLADMASVETEPLLLAQQIEGLVLCLQEIKEEAVRAALEKSLVALSERKGNDWIENVIRTAYTQLVLATFEWMEKQNMLRGSYPGQYAELAKFGSRGIEALLRLGEEGHHRAILALLDIKPKEYAEKIEQLYKEKKLPQIAEVEALLYLFGKEEYFSKRLKEAENDLSLSPSNTNRMMVLVFMYRLIGRYDHCEEIMLGMGRQTTITNWSHYFNLACYQAMQKKVDAALKSFERALQLGCKDYEWIKQDKELDNIRGTREFKELLKKYLGVEEEQQEEKNEEKSENK
ncbi:MAG: hypothetical protein N2234_05715 [Planctomycetota bacterium]|nr:hypothetical protein [Planctomycetota bacterium]